MDNSNFSRNRHNEHLGVNKLGKNIRKSPLHQPNFGNNNNTNTNTNTTNKQPQPPQPHVYNISKNDFRNIVQQLTGSPSQNLPPPRPPQNALPKPQSMRLQKIRPPPLTPINRPPHIHHPPPQPQPQPHPHPHPHPQPQLQPALAPPYNPNFVRSAPFGQPPVLSPLNRGDSIWANTAESPISAYMRYLQNSMIEQSPRRPLAQPQLHPHPQTQTQHQLQPQSQVQHQPPFPGLLPTPPGSAPFPSPRGFGPAPFPSPRGFGPAHLPSPNSQFGMPSPSFFNLPSPRSPYPLLSPGYQYPPPLTPNFFSHFSQSGILGPGPQTPHSPGILFPSSPSGFFPMPSPRWRDQ